MDRLANLRLRAERSRRAAFDQPVVSDADEARALARGLADELANLQGRDRLLFLATLEEIRAALDARAKRLAREMADHRVTLMRVIRGSAACRGYGAAAARGRRRPERG
jgi:hypothetical protein